MQPVQCNSTVRLHKVQHTQDALSSKEKEHNENHRFLTSPLVLYTCFCFMPDILPQIV